MDDEQTELMARLTALKEQHRDLDAAIDALESGAARDVLQIQRLKKRKLALKDEIRILSSRVLPDISA